MPARNEDLHGNVPDKSDVALILIDMINDLEFPGGDKLFEHTLPVAKRLVEFKRQAKAAGVPVIYVNDNFGRWNSDFHNQVEHCLRDGVRGKPIVEMLKPEKDDYFVLKPKHSGFFATVLDVLLAYLKVKTVVLTGVAGNICVLFTANEAYMRDFYVVTPSDSIASNNPEDNEHALQQMKTILKADITPSTELDWEEIKQRARQTQSQNPPQQEPQQMPVWKVG
jgi:nicotinamidase-related amidase